MSKYMQIDIRIIPFYKENFAKTFPRIFAFFKEVGYESYVSKDRSLYELVDVLQDVVKDPAISDNFRDKLGPFYQRAIEIKKEAREMLLSRKLNELDKLLYQLEDVFEDLNEEIAYWLR
ncbi:MAG TPA: hypothetical protein ENG51_18685 [Deltaproteobacteria bacterium]|nr:hypothetical protein [Deltaproteobacteria bacterium]